MVFPNITHSQILRIILSYQLMIFYLLQKFTRCFKLVELNNNNNNHYGEQHAKLPQNIRTVPSVIPLLQRTITE